MSDSPLDWRLSRREALKLGLSTSVALGFAACGGSSAPTAGASPKTISAQPSAALIKAAQTEGTLTFYSAAVPNALALLIGGFTGAYGISVNLVRLVSATQEIRFTAEVQSG